MNKLLVIVAIAVLFTSLGAAKGVSDDGSRHGEEVTEAVSSTQNDEFDSEEKMQEGIEKDQVKRGMPIGLVTTGKWDDLDMERGVKPGDTKLHDWFEDVRAGKADEGRKEISVKLLNEEGQVEVSVETEEGKEVNVVQRKKILLVDYDGDNTPIIKGIEKDDVKRGMVVALVATGTWDDLEMERAYAMNKAELIDSIASEADISKRSARKGRNPQTGKEIKIPAKKVVKFKLGAELSEKIKTIKEKESDEEYFVHATGLIDEIRDEDDVSFELSEGRKGINAVDVRRTD